MKHPSDSTHFLVHHFLPQVLVVGLIFLLLYLIVRLGGYPGKAGKPGSQEFRGQSRRKQTKGKRKKRV